MKMAFDFLLTPFFCVVHGHILLDVHQRRPVVSDHEVQFWVFAILQTFHGIQAPKMPYIRTLQNDELEHWRHDIRRYLL